GLTVKEGQRRARLRRKRARMSTPAEASYSLSRSNQMTISFSTRLGLVLTAIIWLATLPAARGQQQNANQPGTKWTDEQLRQSVELARVGRKLTPKRWPNDARVAVCLSFDTDSEAPLLRDGTTSPT